MTALGRRERFAVCIWLVVALVVWNGLYDVLLARGARKPTCSSRPSTRPGSGPWVDLHRSALDVRGARRGLAVDAVGRA